MKRTHFFLFTLLLASVVCSAPGVAQIINIPDADLRAAITQTLGKETRAPLTREDMERLTRLRAHNKGIADLRGLEFATNLGEIRANDNLIDDLSPLAKLLQLNVIELRHNLVSDLSPIAGLSNLTWLIVNDNLIEDLSPIADLSLNGLEISHNAVSDFSALRGMRKLTHIWLSENPFADLSDFTGLTRLRNFHSWGTPVINIESLKTLPKLKVLDICGGEISDLTALAGLTQLTELYLVGNEITDISPLASLTHLKRLELRHNQVSDVSPLASLLNLQQIDLRHNDILDFSPLDVFAKNVSILGSDNPGFIQSPSARKIEGPWLWIILPTGGVSGSKAAASRRDYLAQASGRQVTEQKISTQGATEGQRVGNKVWTAGKLPRRGPNNINDMVNATGLGTDNIDFHVAYGSIVLESPRQQQTRMFVGSGDAVKVWLNGRLVHNNPVDRDASDYQEDFPVTLKQGRNILLVAVYEGDGWWSGFFGFDANTEYETYLQAPAVVVGRNRVADVNGDGGVSILDLILVSRDLGKLKILDPRTDINQDGQISVLDLILVAQRMDAAAPSAVAADTQGSAAMLRAWIAAAEALNDGSLAFRQGIANLQRLLALMIPDQTVLLANYPNPFNPETWIPYALATPASVRVSIYDARGALVRTLMLGHQDAGVYQSKDRAVYWDGRNQVGEPVASGLYFYTLTAGDFTATRKMLIRK